MKKQSKTEAERPETASVIAIVTLMQGHDSHSAGCRDVASPAPPTHTSDKMLTQLWKEQLCRSFGCKHGGLGGSPQLAKSSNAVTSGCA